MADLASQIYAAYRAALSDPTSVPAWGNASTEEREAWGRAAEVARVACAEEIGRRIKDQFELVKLAAPRGGVDMSPDDATVGECE